MINSTKSLIAICCSQYRLPPPAFVSLTEIGHHRCTILMLNKVWSPWNNFFVKNPQFTLEHSIFHRQSLNSSWSVCQCWCQQWRHPLALDGIGMTLPRHPKMLSHPICSELSCLGAHSALFPASCLQMSPEHSSLLHQLPHASVGKIGDQKMMTKNSLHHNSNYKYQITNTLLFLHFLLCVFYAYKHHCCVQCSIERE